MSCFYQDTSKRYWSLSVFLALQKYHDRVSDRMFIKMLNQKCAGSDLYYAKLEKVSTSYLYFRHKITHERRRPINGHLSFEPDVSSMQRRFFRIYSFSFGCDRNSTATLLFLSKRHRNVVVLVNPNVTIATTCVVCLLLLACFRKK